MRPIYESQADIKNEIDVANTLTGLWNCEFKKIKRSYHVDWMVLRNGSPVGFAELKCRFVNRNTYPTFMLSLEKWMRGKELSKKLAFHLWWLCGGKMGCTSMQQDHAMSPMDLVAGQIGTIQRT